MSAFRSVVFPEPVPPGDQHVPPGSERAAGGAEHRLGEGALAHEILGRERAAPEPPDGHGHVGARGRSADGDPGAVLEPGVQDRPRGRIEPERPCDVDGRPVEPRGR